MNRNFMTNRIDRKKIMGQCVKERVKQVKDFPKKEFLLKLVGDAANARRSLEQVVQGPRP